jgi:hypothetical protein
LSGTDLFRCAATSRHFTFEAFGRTVLEAEGAFAAGILRHCEQTGADVATWGADMIIEAEPKPFRFGACYREGYLLIEPKA